jgi:hypothetical protein
MRPNARWVQRCSAPPLVTVSRMRRRAARSPMRSPVSIATRTERRPLKGADITPMRSSALPSRFRVGADKRARSG